MLDGLRQIAPVGIEQQGQIGQIEVRVPPDFLVVHQPGQPIGQGRIFIGFVHRSRQHFSNRGFNRQNFFLRHLKADEKLAIGRSDAHHYPHQQMNATDQCRARQHKHNEQGGDDLYFQRVEHNPTVINRSPHPATRNEIEQDGIERKTKQQHQQAIPHIELTNVGPDIGKRKEIAGKRPYKPQREDQEHTGQKKKDGPFPIEPGAVDDFQRIEIKKHDGT